MNKRKENWIPLDFADKADKLIKQTAKDIINGANMEDVHTILYKEIPSEEQIYLIYMAACLLVETLQKEKGGVFRRAQ